MAAISRTSTPIVRVPPTRSNSRSWSTRSSLICIDGGHLAHLVEEERAAVRQLEPALAVGDRAGEGAAHVAEQLALDDGLGQRRAVHLDERAARPLAAVVDRLRHQLLAGAGLAQRSARWC